ncbi:hypothetical protein [Pseudobacteriovorax antillogorgiicola]|uniref:Uncharacterized protein n=1 Tax=Pseudobacteriovorax antillogorgiicola TaxID=1513793 RepID=A0A1Y6CR48_9BACT|nr:hypothetical protein [Pseudobacteriovorax antillogorgiicola]TCS46138.1 hypothetical protein EDD56_12539 [Pseudobacteriovorax antillogorgiicola]SMF69681.1 hypothetical protein SAMN06296036_12539 [Pseudobacteriovorax antillogorgiicola]
MTQPWHGFRILIALGVALLCQSLQANGGLVPAIRNVGVIPVQWQSSPSMISPLAKFKALSETAFSPIVRSAKRFQQINDTIVENNWATPNGRKLLVDEFELDGYLSLNVDEQSDLVIMTVRLLSPQLNNYLVESERILKSWILTQSERQLQLRLKKLVFRLLNRYPIDVFVTSVQGSFITLSGGKNQNLFEGDELQFYDVQITQIHPANGAWLNYDYKYLGRAKVIDSKDYSAIARLTSLAFEGAIKNSSSAKITHINSRRLFAQMDEESPPLPISNQARIADLKAPTKIPSPEDQIIVALKPDPTPPPAAQEPPAPPEETETEDDEPPMEPTPEPVDDGPGFLANVHNFFQNQFSSFHAIAGLNLWSATGTSSSSAKFPFWLVNHLEAWGHIPVEKGHELRLGSSLGFGETGDGGFFGLGLSAEYTVQSPQPGLVFQEVDGIAYGALVELETTQASGSSYGGYDALILGGLIKAYGRHHLVESSQTIEGELAMKLKLLAFGQAGLSGTTASISGAFGYELQALAILKDQPDDWEWGGLFRYESTDFTVDSGSLTYGHLFLGGMARLRF